LSAIEVRLTLETLNDQVYLITAAQGTFGRIAHRGHEIALRCGPLDGPSLPF
jgi:hypothetical protein